MTRTAGDETTGDETAGDSGTFTLDTSGLLCPMPVIRTQDCVRRLGHGDVLTVTATDPGVLHDIPAWCRVHGHDFVSSHREGRTYTVIIRVTRQG